MPTKNDLGGFDLLAVKLKQNKIIKIEVKTRTNTPKPKETSENIRRIFRISKNELDESDFIICTIYPLIKRVLIVKSSDVPRDKNRNGRLFIILSGENYDMIPKAQKYGSGIDNWELLDQS